MSKATEQGKRLLTIKEVVEQTGLPASTIRYYDQQFEEFLDVERGAGRRRLFAPDAVERLLQIRRMLKDEGLSLRQARQALAGGEGPATQADNGRLKALENRVAALEEQVRRFKEIQEGTLALLSELTGSK